MSKYNSGKFNAEILAQQVGMMSVEEVRLMQNTVRELFGDGSSNPPLVVNIGGNVGTSSIAILEAVPYSFVWSIDKKPCPKENQNAILAAGFDLSRRIVRVLGNSVHVGEYWPTEIDILVIDGDHTEVGCGADFMAWKDKVKPGGVIFFHDYDHQKAPGVTVVADKVEKIYPVERIGKERYLLALKVEGRL